MAPPLLDRTVRPSRARGAWVLGFAGLLLAGTLAAAAGGPGSVAAVYPPSPSLTTTTVPTTVAPTTTVGPTTTVAPSTTVPVPPGECPPGDPIDPTLALPLLPGETVSDGGLGLTRPEGDNSPISLEAEQLAADSTVCVSVRISQKFFEEFFPPDAFDPNSSFDIGALLRDGGPRGFSLLGVQRVDLDTDDDTFAAFVERLRSEVLLQYPGADLDRRPPYDTARFVAVFDFTHAGGYPESSLDVVWYSDPVTVLRARLDRDGRGAGKFAVPDTLITAGDADTLRVFATYALPGVCVPGDGCVISQILLPDDLAALVEPGSTVLLNVLGRSADGRPLTVTVEVPLLPLVDPTVPEEPGAGFPWWILIVVIMMVLAALLLVFLLRRRRDGSDGDDGGRRTPVAPLPSN